MKGVILGIKKRKDSMITYKVMLTEDNKNVLVNIFENMHSGEISKSSVIEVEKKGNFYNFLKIVKENKQAVSNDFSTGEEFNHMLNQEKAVELCFSKAIDLCAIQNTGVTEKTIVANASMLYKAFCKFNEDIKNGSE